MVESEPDTKKIEGKSPTCGTVRRLKKIYTKFKKKIQLPM
jgi:hypothetical protein